jgi:[ribosomal protein S5]-alanine N-acetyltransferase
MADLPNIPELTTSRLVLRRLVEADAPGLHAAYGDADAMRFWDALPSRDEAETAARIRQSLEVSPRWHAAFAVLLRQGNDFIGMVNYHQRQPWHGRLAVGWIVARPWWRQGYAAEATGALLEHCFTTLGTHRIEAHIEPGNAASLGLAARLGFRYEGMMRDWLFVAGQPRDMLLHALLRPEWRRRAPP